jgi:hypothetical protein
VLVTELAAAAKYGVVLDIVGVVNEVACPTGTPPVDAVYQSTNPELEVAPIVRVPVPQRDAGEVLVIVCAFMLKQNAITKIVIAFFICF